MYPVTAKKPVNCKKEKALVPLNITTMLDDVVKSYHDNAF